VRKRARAGLALLLAAAALGARASSAATEREAELARLRDAVSEARARVARFESEGRGLLDALESLDRSVFELEAGLERSRRAARDAERDLARIRVQTRGIEERLAVLRRAMSARAVGLYKAGEAGALPVLFAADGLRDFLARVYALRRMLERDASLLSHYEREVEALRAARERAAQAEAAHAEAVREIGTRRAQLVAEQETKRGLLSRARADRTRERGLLIELETAARGLERALENLDPGAAPAVDAPGRFAAQRGRLPAPVRGRVVRGFGRSLDAEFRTETYRKGIDFEAPEGTRVSAIAAGRVRFAGWFSAYGNLVIIDHGDDYFSVHGHLSEISVAVGDEVETGSRIGSLGDTGSLSGPKLYFELRRGKTPLDPAAWLARGAGVD
jgi:septal ring factor EnvC (AmiA/AmiB activator)